MWPQASLHFYQILIQKIEEDTTFPRNQDYPHLLLANIPVPDLIEDKSNHDITINMVNSEARNLEQAWVDFLVMPCNTMHLFKKDIIKGVKIPFISMIDCVSEKIQRLWFKRVWLLWSSTTMQSELYISTLNDIWVEVHVPEIQKHNSVSQIIHNYIAGQSNQKDIDLLQQYYDELIVRWSEAVILWCTELPLVLKTVLHKYDFIISSEILAEKALEYSQN